MGHSVGISRNPHTLSLMKTICSVEVEEQAVAWWERKRGADGDWESSPVSSRQAGDRETRSNYPSLWGVTAEKKHERVFHRRRAFLSVNCRGKIICLGRMTVSFGGGVQTGKRPEPYVYLLHATLKRQLKKHGGRLNTRLQSIPISADQRLAIGKRQ